jgi:hypothetical protein
LREDFLKNDYTKEIDSIATPGRNILLAINAKQVAASQPRIVLFLVAKALNNMFR